MRVYVINLERSVVRRETMLARLDALAVNYKFFPAIDGAAGKHLDFPNYCDEFCLKSWRRPLTAGEVGCFASHYLLWKHCVEYNEPLIVMEDDVTVSPRFVQALQLLPNLAALGYIRLAGTSAAAYRILWEDLSADWKLVRFLRGPMGTQCYALFPHGAARLLARAAKWTQPVDDYIDSFWLHDVSCLGLHPFVVSMSKTIDSTISLPGQSPSALMRNRVWRPKRFLARKLSELRRDCANLEYGLGLRRFEGLKDVVA